MCWGWTNSTRFTEAYRLHPRPVVIGSFRYESAFDRLLYICMRQVFVCCLIGLLRGGEALCGVSGLGDKCVPFFTFPYPYSGGGECVGRWQRMSRKSPHSLRVRPKPPRLTWLGGGIVLFRGAVPFRRDDVSFSLLDLCRCLRFWRCIPCLVYVGRAPRCALLPLVQAVIMSCQPGSVYAIFSPFLSLCRFVVFWGVFPWRLVVWSIDGRVFGFVFLSHFRFREGIIVV